ncbi:MAG: hypothetical protein R3D89_10625 [Sphingomonadaceae bacterium]|jgi:hypothetical protein
MKWFWLFHPATVAAIGAVALAALAWWADRRRIRRDNLDRVGFMPWTAIFFVSLIAALVLAGLAIGEWPGGI